MEKASSHFYFPFSFRLLSIYDEEMAIKIVRIIDSAAAAEVRVKSVSICRDWKRHGDHLFLSHASASSG